jgi:hypothetical protein
VSGHYTPHLSFILSPFGELPRPSLSSYKPIGMPLFMLGGEISTSRIGNGMRNTVGYDVISHNLSQRLTIRTGDICAFVNFDQGKDFAMP